MPEKIEPVQKPESVKDAVKAFEKEPVKKHEPVPKIKLKPKNKINP